MMSIPKSELLATSKAIQTEDIPQLVEWLSSQDDNIRYQAFLLLQNRSAYFLIASAKPELCEKIASSLISLNPASVKETMRNSILVDILKVLLVKGMAVYGSA
ncbi:MAG TPA: hypothetical protein GX499_07520 [Clostridiales bacterium]|nr:hypothetical protein [Clostridiales bacterium]